MAFSGTFDYTLDAKHRLTVPARMRSSLTESVMLTRGQAGRCLSIWPKRDFEAFAAEALEGLHPLDAKRAQIKRFFFTNAFETELDSAGRVGLPAELREWAGLTKDVKVNGVQDAIEIWDRATWDQHNATLSFDSFADAFGTPGP